MEVVYWLSYQLYVVIVAIVTVGLTNAMRLAPLGITKRQIASLVAHITAFVLRKTTSLLKLHLSTHLKLILRLLTSHG